MAGWRRTQLIAVNRDPVAPAFAAWRAHGLGTTGGGYELNFGNIPPTGLVRTGNISELPPGQYAVVASSPRPIEVIASHAWPCTGAACVNGSVQAGRDVLVPLVMRHYYGHETYITIQNTERSRAVTVTAELRPAGEGALVLTTEYTIAAGVSMGVDLARSGPFVGVRPNDPGGFIGTLRVIAGGDVAVYAVHDVVGSPRAVYDHAGVPRENGAMRLHVPLAVLGDARGTGRWGQTWLAVANAGDVTTDVHVAYHGFAGSCAGATFEDSAPVRLPPHAMRLLRTQSPGFPRPWRIIAGDCLASATIDADDSPVIAAVVHLSSDDPEDYGSASDSAAATLGQPADDAATGWILWDWHRQWTARGGFIEAIVHNPGSRPATVTLTPRDADGAAIPGCGVPCQIDVPPGSTRILQAEATTVLPAGVFGSALVRSDEPVIVWLRGAFASGEMDETLAPAVPIASEPVSADIVDRNVYVPQFYQPGLGSGCPPPTGTPRVAPSRTATPGATNTSPPSRSAYLPAVRRGVP